MKKRLDRDCMSCSRLVQSGPCDLFLQCKDDDNTLMRRRENARLKRRVDNLCTNIHHRNTERLDKPSRHGIQNTPRVGQRSKLTLNIIVYDGC